MKQKTIDRIELELFSAIIKYIVPSIKRKVITKREWNLEAMINDSRPKIGFDDIKELESAVLESSDGISVKRRSSISTNFALYSSNFTRKKSKTVTDTGYSITIRYEETQTSEKLKVEIRTLNETYTTEIKNVKPVKDKVTPYSVILNYEDSYGKERLSISYKRQFDRYQQAFMDSREDMSNMVPLKWLNIHPETNMGGVLGFTYIGDPSMGRRADLTGWMARMVDVHESIHTPDEYETRVLTSWIMEKVRMGYKK